MGELRARTPPPLWPSDASQWQSVIINGARSMVICVDHCSFWRGVQRVRVGVLCVRVGVLVGLGLGSARRVGAVWRICSRSCAL